MSEEPAGAARGARGRPAFGADGLVTAIAQDATSGEVLMVAHMDEAAWEATLRDGYATFWSRSRARQWRKGETSGNTLRVRSISLDCDGDSVLLRVDAAGPACHTGARSCFFTESAGASPFEGGGPGGPGPSTLSRGAGPPVEDLPTAGS